MQTWIAASKQTKPTAAGTRNLARRNADSNPAAAAPTVHVRTQPFSEFRCGQDFSTLRVVGQGEAVDDVPSNQPVPDAMKPDEGSSGEELGGNSTCPVTAVFSSTLAGFEKSGCQVPSGKFGASKLARFHLTGLPDGANSVTIGEQFKAIDDPYSAFGLLKPNSFTTSGSIFDDCYLLASDKQLPPDFVLKVEQNHLLNGNIISKNEITYTADSVSFCFHQRLPESCDFGARCRR